MTRFAIVGTGRISDWVLKGAVQDARFKAVAVCSRTEEAARCFIRKHPEAFGEDALVFTTIEELAACPDVDAVYIGTPNSTHCKYAVRCLDAGKHVLCEKPLGCNAEEVEEMIRAASNGGSVLMEAMISTLNPNFRAVADRVEDIGPVHKVFASYCQYSTRLESLKRGEVANSFDPRMGGGALEDIGIYTIYPIVSLFGEPDEVLAVRSTMPFPCGDVELEGSAVLRYGNGMVASISYSKAVDAHVPTEFCGERGNLVLDNIHNARQAEFVPHAAPSAGRGPAPVRETLASGLEMDDYYYEFQEFLDVLDRGLSESLVNRLETSLSTRRVMDKIKNH